MSPKYLAAAMVQTPGTIKRNIGLMRKYAPIGTS
jgi:hypothetical protein